MRLLRSLLPRTQPHLAQQSFGRGGIGNIRRSSVRPTHIGGRELEVGASSSRITRPYADIVQSGLFCRTQWCRHPPLVSRCPQGRSRGRVRGQGYSRTRRGNHHRKHSSTPLNPPLEPSSIRYSTPRDAVAPETYSALVPAPEVRQL